MSKISISLNVDDGAPVNLFYFHDLKNPHELLIPPGFVRKFGKVCEKYDVKGKFSIVPIPACLGRLDENINMVDQRSRKEFIRLAQKYIKPRFSITPEILTHFQAWNLQHNSGMHMHEDQFISTKSAEEIAEYVGLALQILDNVGLTPSGVSSPWATGANNEQNYAAGIGMAFKRILNRNRCFYFLHRMPRPILMCDTPETGRVIHVPANCGDQFWPGNMGLTAAQTRKKIKQNLDEVLTEDGKKGMLREFADQGEHFSLITHWTSLFSDGGEYGLEGFEYLLERIKKVFGNEIEWKMYEELEAQEI